VSDCYLTPNEQFFINIIERTSYTDLLIQVTAWAGFTVHTLSVIVQALETGRKSSLFLACFTESAN
jgi:hypothetical protein